MFIFQRLGSLSCALVVQLGRWLKAGFCLKVTFRP